MRKPTTHPSPSEPTEPEIQRLAYHLWVEGGCLEGVELDNWLTAKERLRHQPHRSGKHPHHSSTPAIPAAKP